MRKFTKTSKRVFTFITLLLLVIICFCYAMFQGGFVSWFLFGSFIPIAIYSLGVYFYPLKKIQVQREMKQHEFNAGERVSIQLNFTRPNRFPLFYCLIEDDISDNFKTKYTSSLKFLLFPLFKARWTYTYNLEQIPRGEYEFKGLRLIIGDFFGLVRKEYYLEDEQKILGYPAYAEMKYEPFENHFELGMSATKDKVQRDSTMAISIREYVPGDKFSWIHWKQTARKNEIMTKEFEQRQTHDVMLVLDRSPHPAFELSVTFTATLIRAVIKKGAQVGLFSMGQKIDIFPIQSGDSQLRTLNYHLARVEANAPIAFSEVIESELSLKNQNNIVIFIVNHLTKAVVEKISALSQRKGHIALFVIKDRSQRLNNEELVLLDSAKMRGLVTKVIYEGQFTKAFDRG